MTSTQKIQNARMRHRQWSRREFDDVPEELRYEVLQQWLHDIASMIYDLGQEHGADE